MLEAIILSVTPSYVAYLEQKQPQIGGLLRRLKSNVDRPLSAILSLNTIAHTVGAAGVGAQSQKVFGDAYVTATSIVLTFLILVLSEIIPKTLGATHWRSLAPVSSRTLSGLILVLYPLVGMSQGITRLLSRNKDARLFNIAEFGALADLGVQEGAMGEDQSRIVKNLIRFRSLRGKDIMTPRTVVVAYSEDTHIEEIAGERMRLPVSRIPIYRSSIDDITGYVLRDDLIMRVAEGAGRSRLRSCKRKVLILPDLVKLQDLFQRLLEEQEHIAVLVDEYGGLSGVVSMEDVVETLIGIDIVDEEDSTRNMREAARERWHERAQRLGLVTEEETGGSDSEERERPSGERGPHPGT
jgi:CBS domain containing-hemolysin-like protein